MNLRDIAKRGQVAQNFRDTDLDEDYTENFSADYIAGVLHEYGKSYGCNLQLGISWTSRQPFICPGADSNGPNLTIWIHNDNNETTRTYGHYSGIASRQSEIGEANEACYDGVEDMGRGDATSIGEEDDVAGWMGGDNDSGMELDQENASMGDEDDGDKWMGEDDDSGMELASEDESEACEE